MLKIHRNLGVKEDRDKKKKHTRDEGKGSPNNRVECRRAMSKMHFVSLSTDPARFSQTFNGICCVYFAVLGCVRACVSVCTPACLCALVCARMCVHVCACVFVCPQKDWHCGEALCKLQECRGNKSPGWSDEGDAGLTEVAGGWE